MKSTYTTEDARQWVAVHRESIMKGMDKWAAENPSTPKAILEFIPFQECWQSGCWLSTMLTEHGATKGEAEDIGFAHGQRSTFGDTWQWAVTYLNEFITTRAVKDKPGLELAQRINEEVFSGLKQ